MTTRLAKVRVVLAATTIVLASCSSSSAGNAAGGWRPAAHLPSALEGGGSGLGTDSARLADGTVLVAGGYHTLSNKFELTSRFYLSSAEIYDPSTNKWRKTGSMNQARFGAAVILLAKTGQVLAAGGSAGSDAVITPSAELFDPHSGTWTFVNPMNTCRVSPSSSVLPDGDVLLAGGVGCNGQAQASAEIYHVASRSWTDAAPMAQARWGQSATVLADGRVLVSGGRSTPVGANPEQVLSSAEIYDPSANTWSPAAPMHVGRVLQSATLLSSGLVLVAGGHTQASADPHSATATAELWDPRTNTWTMTGKMNAPREEGGSTMLPDGTFLMAGGGQQASAEIYDPSTARWALTEPMQTIHDDAQLVMLKTGQVLIAGGFRFGPNNSYINTATAELFTPSEA